MQQHRMTVPQDRQQEPQGRREINVRVMNGTMEEYRDIYNGAEYVFQPGKTKSLPLEAAHHIFGYSVQGSDAKKMFDHVCKRWGWNSPENVKDGFKKIQELWSKFTFTPVQVRFTEVPVIDTGALAEPREKEAATA